MNPELRAGIALALGSHCLWGIFPIFWRQLQSVDATQLVLHRILWSLTFLLLLLPVLYWKRPPEERRRLFQRLRSWKLWALHGTAGLFVATNWLAFIWAVNHDQVLEASLGYYINPLLGVLLGVVVLGERLRPRQWFAIGMIGVGVAIMTWATGRLPMVALVMASTFAVYALIKKKTPVPAVPGLAMEMAPLAPWAIAALWWIAQNSQPAMGRGVILVDVLIVAGGIITVAPLMLFAAALQRVGMALMGILQYVGPTLQFVVGVFLFGEPVSGLRLLGFAFVWTAIGLYVSTPRKADSPNSAAAPQPESPPVHPAGRNAAG